MVPGGKEICERQLFATVETMENVDLSNSDIDSFMDVIYEQLKDMTKEEVIKRFVALEFNRFLDYYKNAKDLNVNESANRDRNERRKDRKDRRDDRDRGDRGERRERKGNPNMQRCYVNLGSTQNISPSAIIGIINRATPGKSVDIGDIEILKKFSFFEVDPKYADDVITSMNGMDYHGEDVLVEKAQSKGASSPSRDRNSSNRRSGGGGSRNSGGGNRRSYGDRNSGGDGGNRRSGKDSSRQRKAKKRW